MRFMMLVKHPEKFSGPPPKELVEAMEKLNQDSRTAGIIVSSGGLAPMAASTRVRLSQGKVTALDGPFVETKEIVGVYAVLEFNSKQEAVEGAIQFMELHRKYWPAWEGETEVRQIFNFDDYNCDNARANLKEDSISRK